MLNVDDCSASVVRRNGLTQTCNLIYSNENRIPIYLLTDVGAKQSDERCILYRTPPMTMRQVRGDVCFVVDRQKTENLPSERQCCEHIAHRHIAKAQLFAVVAVVRFDVVYTLSFVFAHSLLRCPLLFFLSLSTKSVFGLSLGAYWAHDMIRLNDDDATGTPVPINL